MLVETDCENALKTVRKDAPDLVFLDVVMPGINELAMYEDESNFYNVSGIFNKGHDFSKALTLIKAALEKK